MLNWKVVVLCAAAVVCLGCGTSSEGSRYNMQHGRSDSGYPPAGSGQNTGSPAISSMGGDVNAKGVEAEPTKVKKQDIPSNVAAVPRS